MRHGKGAPWERLERKEERKRRYESRVSEKDVEGCERTKRREVRE